MSELRDRREEFADVPWQQGRLLFTEQTKHGELRRLQDEQEKRGLFAHFSSSDQGRSRVRLWHFDTAEECAAAVKEHNDELAKRVEAIRVRIGGK